MKQAKLETKEQTEKQNTMANAQQNPTAAKKDDQPSWAAYYLLISMAVGILLILLKFLGVF